MLREFFVAVFASLAAFGLSACGNGDSAAPAPSSSALKVGLLVTGSTSDHGWNQLAADSLSKLAAQQPAGAMETQVLQQVKSADAADQIRQLESKGFALAIAHGFEFQDAAKELTDPSKPNPVKIKIVVSGGDAANPNFQSLDYDLAPASYELGIIAAKVSRTGKLGFIGGEKIPTVTVMEAGFLAGARSVNPAATVNDAYTGWDNPAAAKEKAEAMISQGVDVIMQNVDAASSGVFEAVAEENANPKDDIHLRVYTFGANSDQNANPICGDYTLASAVIKLDIAFGKAIEQVKSNSFKGGLVKEGLADGVCVAVLNPKLTGKLIDADTQKLVDDAGKKIITGEIKLPPPPQ